MKRTRSLINPTPFNSAFLKPPATISCPRPAAKASVPRPWRGKRGAGVELAIVTLLVVTALSMLIVSAAVVDTKTTRLNEKYTARRTALAFLGEEYVATVTEGRQFSEADFRSRHVFFTDAYTEAEGYCRQSVAVVGQQTTYRMTFGNASAYYLSIEITKTQSGDSPTYQITEWEANP